MRVAKTIELDEHTERELRVLAKRRRVEARLQQRALVVLLASQGPAEQGHRRRAGLDRRRVALWRQRFLGAASMCFASKRPRTPLPDEGCLPRKASTTISTCSARRTQRSWHSP